MKEKKTRNEQSLRDIWDNIKDTSIHVTGTPEEEEWEKGKENILEEIMMVAENFLDFQLQAWQREEDTKSYPTKTTTKLDKTVKSNHFSTLKINQRNIYSWKLLNFG